MQGGGRGEATPLLLPVAGLHVHDQVEFDEAWRVGPDVDLTGVFFCAQRAARVMTARSGGSIVTSETDDTSPCKLIPHPPRGAHPPPGGHWDAEETISRRPAAVNPACKP